MVFDRTGTGLNLETSKTSQAPKERKVQTLQAVLEDLARKLGTQLKRLHSVRGVAAVCPRATTRHGEGRCCSLRSCCYCYRRVRPVSHSWLSHVLPPPTLS